MWSILNKVCDSLGISLDFLNRDNSPSNNVSMRGSSVGSLQQAGRDINNITIAHQRHETPRPRIDSDQWGGSGGANGFSVEFYVKNIGTEVAMDVVAEFVADDAPSIKIAEAAHSLSQNQSSRLITYRYDSTVFFKREVKNPRIIFRYKAADGRQFVSGRGIIQEHRAAGGFNIHTKAPTEYFDRDLGKEQPDVEFEVERVDFNLHRRSSEGLAESFSVMISVLIKNLSQEMVLIRKAEPRLAMPDGYRNHSYHSDFNYPNGRNLGPREVLPCKFGYTVSIEGERVGMPLHELPEWMANKNKLLSTIESGKVELIFHAESVTPNGVKKVDQESDLTDQLLKQIFTGR